MDIAGSSLDELLEELYPALLKSNLKNIGTRGATSELLGVLLRLSNPRARMSRSENRGKIFSAIGELLWYLSGSNCLEFIGKYAPAYADDATEGVIHGAYGPRLFHMHGQINQVDNVCRLLNCRRGSRRAVIQLFDARDIATYHKEIPCTTSLQFLLRDGNLHLSVTLRSNDAYFEIPHDIFCFTMLQEMMARRLNVELGSYYHYVGSMHMYENRRKDVARYLDEGYQKPIEMRPMPKGNPFLLIPILLEAERKLRYGDNLAASDIVTNGYWADIIRLLQVFWQSTDNHRLDTIRRELCDPVYYPYLDGRRGVQPPTFCQPHSSDQST